MLAAALALLALAAAAACGGEREPAPPPPPAFPAGLAERLAARSDTVADLLAGGDSCGARSEAQRLQADTIAAVNAGEVPGSYQEDVLGDVTALAETIACPPAGDGAKGAAAARSLSRKLRTAATTRST